MIADAPLTIRGLNVRAVRVPLSRPHPTAGGTVSEAPLVLVDLLTEEGVTRVRVRLLLHAIGT